MNWRGVSPFVAFQNMGGDLSFTKLVIATVVVAHFIGRPFSAIMATIVIAASFGKSTFEGFLQRGMFDATDTNVTETKSITERRINVPGEPGVEPS